MDFSNYQDIVELVRKLCRGLSPEDQEDFVHDVCVKLLASGKEQANKSLIRRIIRQLKIDHARKEDRKPLVYDNELVEKYSDDV